MRKGKKYSALLSLIEKNKEYDIAEAVELFKKSTLKFDQTVEIHMNLGVDPKHSDQLVRGNVVLPHGTGRKVRVLVFAKGDFAKQATEAGAEYVGAEEFGDKIKDGWLDFDSVVATPDMMPLIGRLAKILGPRGLMPSPKTGTVTTNVAQVVKELKAGKIAYRVDKGANVHAPIGKLSFGAQQIAENAAAMIDSVKKNKPQTSKGTYIKSLFLTATMTPSVKLSMALTR
jgi:large subunit ribosomal protein L1